jgi:hypothetical protein
MHTKKMKIPNDLASMICAGTVAAKICNPIDRLQLKQRPICPSRNKKCFNRQYKIYRDRIRCLIYTDFQVLVTRKALAISLKLRSAGEDALQRKNNALKPQYYGSETKAFKNRTMYNGKADRIRSSLLPCTKPQSVICVLKRASLKHASASTKHPCITCKLLQLFTSVCGTDARWTTMFITGTIATIF